MKLNLESENFSIIGESLPIREVFDVVERAAGSQSTVMIYGESGTGKELIARLIAGPFPMSFWKASSLAMKKGPSQELSTLVLVEWNWPIREPFSLMKLVICPLLYR